MVKAAALLIFHLLVNGYNMLDDQLVTLIGEGLCMSSPDDHKFQGSLYLMRSEGISVCCETAGTLALHSCRSVEISVPD